MVLRVEAEQIVRTETDWRTSWGSFSKDLINSRVLVISMRKLGDGTGPVNVRWYFIGRDFDKDRLMIYDSGESNGEIALGGIVLAPTSKELVKNTTQRFLHGRRVSGQIPWGWAVFVSQNGNPLAEVASVPELVQWTENELKDAPKPARKSTREVKFVPNVPEIWRR